MNNRGTVDWSEAMRAFVRIVEANSFMRRAAAGRIPCALSGHRTGRRPCRPLADLTREPSTARFASASSTNLRRSGAASAACASLPARRRPAAQATGFPPWSGTSSAIAASCIFGPHRPALRPGVPMPVSLVHAQGRMGTPKLRVFADRLAGLFAAKAHLRQSRPILEYT
jgi:hypothetical protein